MFLLSFYGQSKYWWIFLCWADWLEKEEVKEVSQQWEDDWDDDDVNDDFSRQLRKELENGTDKK